MWTGEFDSNTLRVDEEVFESGKKKLRIKKISGYVWTGRNLHFVVTTNIAKKKNNNNKKKKKRKNMSTKSILSKIMQ